MLKIIATLLLALPMEFFPIISDPFGAGLLSAIPSAGIVSLLLGLAFCLKYPRKGLFLFLLSAFASHLLVAFGALFQGSFERTESNVFYVLVPFLLLQIGFSIFLVYRLKGARLPALFFTVFSISYALFAWFMAGMIFTNDYL